MYRRGEGAKRLIGADVRSGPLAADVLLACRKCQHESPAALGVGRLAGETPGHLPHEFLVGCNHADKRPSVARRKTEALAFERDDIRLGRRPHEAERNALGHGHDQQRP